MRTVAALLLMTALLLGGCGSDQTAEDSSGGPDPTSEPKPAQVPPAPGPVRTRHLATVMDRGDGRPVQLCVGPVAESYPPQCSGPPITNWDWSQQRREWFNREGGVRWGEFMVVGTFDGERFTVVRSLPAVLADSRVSGSDAVPAPATAYSEDELRAIQDDLMDLPGAVSARTETGHVLVDVLHDDGSLQSWADQTYGDGVVVVTSLLVPLT